MSLKMKFREARILQYIAAIVAALTSASNSSHVSWSSPTVPLLESVNSPIGVSINSEQKSWIVSIRNLGTLIGCLLSILTNDRLGRKTSLILSALPLFVAWILIYFAKSVTILYIARFIVGVGSGILCTTVPIYTAEIAEKDIRGRLSSMFVIMGLFGSLYVYTVGPFVSYHFLAGTCAIVPFIAVICCWFLPESPYHLAKQNRMDDARKILVKLSKKAADEKFIDERVEEIQRFINDDQKKKTKFWKLFTKKQYRKALIIVTGLKTIQHFSGVQPIGSYMQTIIETSGSGLDSKYSSIIFGCVQFVSSITASQIVDRLGRKPMLLISAISCTIALFGEGTYFYVKQVAGYDTSGISWLPLTALVLYELMVTIGISSLPYVIVGEVFTMNVKGFAVSFNTIYGALLAFAANSLYPIITENYGTYTMFWTYGTTCIIGSLFILSYMPETKGKTFDEVQKLLRR